MLALGLVCLMGLPATADMISSYTITEKGNIGTGSQDMVSMTLATSDGSKFDLSTIDGFYGDTDDQVEVLNLNPGQDIIVTFQYNGVGLALSGLKPTANVGADFVVWNGKTTNAVKDAIYNDAYYPPFSAKKNTLSYKISYNDSRLTIFRKEALFDYLQVATVSTSNQVFDLFGQLNDTIGHDKLGIGVRLNYAGTPVPEPATLIFITMGFGLVGRVNKKVLNLI
jgi:hypothetical protein